MAKGGRRLPGTTEMRLYEEAALPPLWRLDGGRTLFVGTLDRNDAHEHGAPVFLSSLGAPFGLRLAGENRWLSVDAAMIPAGVVHELDIGGEPIAVLYAEPTIAGADALAGLLSDREERSGAVVGQSKARMLVRDLYEDRASLGWVDAALDDLLGFGDAQARRAIDPRVAAAARALEASDEETLTLADIAPRVNLSASRLRRLFEAEIGVPFGRYRAWARMRRALDAVTLGHNLTAAAHAAGFADQAHFAHDFRRTFGAPASRSLTGVRRQAPRPSASRPGPPHKA